MICFSQNYEIILYLPKQSISYSDLPNLAEKEERETYFDKGGEAFDANNVFTAQVITIYKNGF